MELGVISGTDLLGWWHVVCSAGMQRTTLELVRLLIALSLPSSCGVNRISASVGYYYAW